MNYSSNVVAVSATVSPWWLPYLNTASENAALILPILGVGWLVIQITHFFYKRYYGRD